MVVLETALPVKFAETIVEALGREPDRPAAFWASKPCPALHGDEGRAAAVRLHRKHA